MAMRKTRPRTSQVPVRLFRLVRVPFYDHKPAQCGQLALRTILAMDRSSISRVPTTTASS